MSAKEEMVTISISVPRRSVDKLNAKLDGHTKPPRKDPVTKAVIIDAVYPNGIADWVQQLVGNAIGQAIGNDDEDVKAAQEEIAAIQRRCQEKYHPVVTVE